MKILVIPTGGTICTGENGRGTLSIQARAGIKIVENYKSTHSENIGFDIAENLMILSENMTVTKWNKILDVYRKNIKKDSYSGVIILHGTDTLGFSASSGIILKAKALSREIIREFVSSQFIRKSVLICFR